MTASRARGGGGVDHVIVTFDYKCNYRIYLPYSIIF